MTRRQKGDLHLETTTCREQVATIDRLIDTRGPVFGVPSRQAIESAPQSSPIGSPRTPTPLGRRYTSELTRWRDRVGAYRNN